MRDLGDDNFLVREEASRRLWAAGTAAEKALRGATGSPDAEVSRRARDILERFKWGIYPDTPKKVVELINRYQEGDRGGTQSLIRELFDNGAAGCRAVLKIANAEEDAGVRRRLFSQIANEMHRAMPFLLAGDELDTLALLLDAGLQQDVPGSVNHYVAYWTLRGKLDERIAAFRERAEKDAHDLKAREVLAYLYRAKGDAARAREAAEKCGRAELLKGLLQEAGDWKELAKLEAADDTPADAERLGFRAAYFRLAGDDKALGGVVAALKKEAAKAAERKPTEDTPEDEGAAFVAAKALFLNDRPADATEILVRYGNRVTAFEVMVARSRYRDALKLVDREKAENGKQLAELEIVAARTLWGLGEKDKARPVFARYGALLKPDAIAPWNETLVDAELRAGLREQAVAHAAAVMAAAKDAAIDRRLLQKLFPDESDKAEVWWDYLRKRDPKAAGPAVLREVGDILSGKLDPARLQQLIAGAPEVLKSQDPRPEVSEQWTLALAAAAAVAGQRGLARATLEKSSTEGAQLRLGDLLAEDKLWEAAAEAYRRAWEDDRQKPLPLFLWGRALAAAGHEAEGRRRMEQAHWLPLGNESRRYDFATALAQRGLTDAARKENELLLRVSQPASYHAGEAIRRAALAARAKGDYLLSADGQERAMLRCLRAYVSFVQPAAYVGVPALIHRQRARGHLAAGQFGDALREAALSLEAMPGDVDVAVLLVPGLEKAGRQRDADDLYGRVAAVLRAVCKDYPNSAWAHNSAAWLSACCRRELDEGLAHARRATELVPDVAGYQDTLAEVWFQLGRKDKAVLAQKRAVELDPKKPYYRKQLQRIEAGDPAATRPAEEEDEDD